MYYAAYVAVILLFLSIFIFASRPKVHVIQLVRYIGFVVFFSIFALSYATYASLGRDYAVADSLINSLQCFAVNSNTALIDNTSFSPPLFLIIYRVSLYFFYIIAPLSAISITLSFFSSFFDRLRIRFFKKKDLFIFSCLNERTLCLTKGLQVSGNVRIIFCNIGRDLSPSIPDKARKRDYILTSLDIEALPINFARNTIHAFLFSDDYVQNLQQTIRLSERLKATSSNPVVGTSDIYLLSDHENAEHVLRNMDTGNVPVHLINPDRITVYHLLDNRPLYHAIDNDSKTLSILIIGGESLALEFVKTCSWIGQLERELEIHVISPYAGRIEQKIRFSSPGLFAKKASITFMEAELNTDRFKQQVMKCGEKINYIIVASDVDSDNLQTGIWLRGHYLRNNFKSARHPIINVLIQNPKQHDLVQQLCCGRQNYDISLFGSTEEIFCKEIIFSPQWMQFAKNIHLAYCEIAVDASKSDKRKALLDFYNDETSKQSSISNALHIKYKLFTVCGLTYDNGQYSILPEKALQALFSDPIVIARLASLEHERWIAYMYANGWLSAAPEEVFQYYDEQRSHKHSICKLHPCLIPYDELDNLSEIMNKKYRIDNPKKYDFKKSDRDIVIKIPDIVADSWGVEDLSL